MWIISAINADALFSPIFKGAAALVVYYVVHIQVPSQLTA